MLCAMLFFAPAFIHTTKATLITLNTSSMSDEDRQVSGFTGISSSGSFSIKVTMGSKESLRLEGDPETIKEIETIVENGILKIRSKNRRGIWGWHSNLKRVHIYITAKTLNKLSVNGSGDIMVEGIVKTKQLSNSISGSGNISVSADIEDYNAAISGSGKVSIQGTANKAAVKISGSGGFDGKNLKTADASIGVSGSGRASIYASKKLEAVVSGSGNIRYSGQAQISITKSGSGSISKM